MYTLKKFIETAMYTFRSQYRYVHFSAHNTAMYITHFQKPFSKAIYVLNTVSMFETRFIYLDSSDSSLEIPKIGDLFWSKECT